MTAATSDRPKPAPSRSGSIREFPSLSPRFPRKNQLFPSCPFHAPGGFGHSPSRGVSPAPNFLIDFVSQGKLERMACVFSKK